MVILKFSSKQFGSVPKDGLSNNPLEGQTLAKLLRDEYRFLNFKTDDLVVKTRWGWRFHMQYFKQKYMIGTLAYAEFASNPDSTDESADPITYLVQFDKKLSLKERLFRQNTFSKNEPIIDLTTAILKSKISDIQSFLTID